MLRLDWKGVKRKLNVFMVERWNFVRAEIRVGHLWLSSGGFMGRT